MRYPSRKLRALVPLLAIAAATVLLAGPALGQVDMTKKGGELSDAQCYGHHREEGFRSMDLFPVTVNQVKKGEAFEFELTILVPWLHSVLDPVAFVNISGIPGARFPGEKEPFAASFDGALSPASVGPLPIGGGAAGATSATHAIPVEANATGIVATFVGAPGQSGKEVWSLELTAPNGDVVKTPVPDFATATRSNDAYNEWEIRVPYENLTRAGEGEWTARVTHAMGAEANAPYSLDVQVNYDLSKSSELLVKGPDRLEKKEQFTYRFEIIAPPEAFEGAILVYGGRGIAHHLHTDPNAEDYGNYTKWNVMTFPVGDSLVVAGQGPVFVAADPNPIMKAYSQVIGFAASFLLIPAIFLGGTFGRGSVLVLNKLLSARRRVLWHNATSYLLLIVSLLHMFLFLVENFWDWHAGVIWGGLSLAAMIGLAVTGAFQRRYVAAWGFERWRFTHFSMGILVVGFVLVHMLADGTHLAGIREWFAGL